MTESERQSAITILANMCEIFGLEDMRQWLRMIYSERSLDEVLDGYSTDKKRTKTGAVTC